jgi:hypothetical protein
MTIWGSQGGEYKDYFTWNVIYFQRTTLKIEAADSPKALVKLYRRCIQWHDIHTGIPENR